MEKLVPAPFCSRFSQQKQICCACTFSQQNKSLVPFFPTNRKMLFLFPNKTNDLFPGRFVQGFPNKDKFAQKLNKMEKLVPVSQQNVQNVQNGIPEPNKIDRCISFVV